MTARNSIRKMFSTIGSAINAAGAVESHRAPKDKDLRALGISPIEFSRIGRNF